MEGVENLTDPVFKKEAASDSKTNWEVIATYDHCFLFFNQGFLCGFYV